MNKKAELLVENIIFIALNVLFMIILILFLLKQGQGAVLLEQSHAKQIALLIDSANPSENGIELRVNMDKAFKLAEENGIKESEIVKINNNVVKVQLNQDGGYVYSFFNDVDARAFPDSENKGIYIITINKK